MERLWAPWRLQYIQSTVKQPSDQSCVFCAMLAERDDEKNLIVYRGQRAFVVMNLFPYNNGHVMVVPLRHTGEFESLDSADHAELAELLTLTKRALTECYSPQGFNIGMNLGRAAGAGITDHLHYHILPRWNGDANFMSAVAETKVMSESLTEGWRRLRDAVARLAPASAT